MRNYNELTFSKTHFKTRSFYSMKARKHLNLKYFKSIDYLSPLNTGANLHTERFILRLREAEERQRKAADLEAE